MGTPKMSVTNTELVFTEVSWGHTPYCCWENVCGSGHLRPRAIVWMSEDQVRLQHAGRSSAVGVTNSWKEGCHRKRPPAPDWMGGTGAY